MLILKPFQLSSNQARKEDMFIFTLKIIVIIIPKTLFFHSEASQYIKALYLYNIFSHQENNENALGRRNLVGRIRDEEKYAIFTLGVLLEVTRVWSWDLYGKFISHNHYSNHHSRVDWNSDQLVCSGWMLISFKASELRCSLNFTFL